MTPRSISVRLPLWATLVVVVLALSVVSPVLAPARASASAARRAPSGDYAAFASCPLSDAKASDCIFAQTEGGELALGSRTIPVGRAMTLQGGVHEDEATGKQVFIGAETGETLSRTPQTIPGMHFAVSAPTSLPRFAQEIFNEFVAPRASARARAVTATTELAGPASAIGIDTQNLIEAMGIGLSLPVKVKLSSPLLGEDCYIGSDVHPLVIPLTTGSASSSTRHVTGSASNSTRLTTGSASNSTRHAEPSKGKPGHAQFKDEYNLVIIKEDSLLNDSFAAPSAAGCGGILSFLVNPEVDAELGVPLGAGHNRALLNVTLQNANASAVRASK